jgi:hypothetical protein
MGGGSRQKLIDRARNVPGLDPLRHVNILTNYLVNSVFASFEEEIDGISADNSGAPFAEKTSVISRISMERNAGLHLRGLTTGI